MMNKEQATEFAEEWVTAWNSHDLDKILSHYEDDFEMSSPMIIKVMGEPSGRLKGKEKVGAYWKIALERSPHLNFKLSSVLQGANSITIIYEGVRGLSAEVFHFNRSEKVSESYAHYNL